jgi:hypothetical protein
MSELRAWPGPRCATCGAQAPCEARGTLEPSYPACHVPVRPTDSDRLASLVDAWRAHDGDGGPTVRACETVLLARERVDGARYSEIFEPSIGWTRAGGTRLHRFSYAFPGFRADPEDVGRTIAAIVAPFGEGATDVATRVLRAARHPSVAQPLFGLACDGPDAIRLKLYLQFHDAAGDAPLSLAARLMGAPGLPSRAPSAPLHLACVDFAPSGRMLAGKLYFVHRHVDTRAPSPLPPSALLEALAASGVSSLRDVLGVHALSSPDDPAVASPREIDFGLERNELLWSDVRMLAPLAPVVGPGTALATLAARFRLGVRRLTVSTGDVDKANAYYVLAERRTP